MKENRVFLKANWNHLIMANFEVPGELLLPYLPGGTELDTHNGKHYVSIVGFLFEKTEILGIPAFFHRKFEEVNLRFYVTYKENETIKRGTVFISEIVPKPIIPLVANTLYNEVYSFHAMNHCLEPRENELFVRYEWKSKSGWNFLEVKAENKSKPTLPGSMENFISEHYWGYNALNQKQTLEYGVEHISWEVYPVKSCNFEINTVELYGKAFNQYLKNPPDSVFLAGGSDVLIRTPNRIKILPAFSD